MSAHLPSLEVELNHKVIYSSQLTINFRPIKSFQSTTGMTIDKDPARDGWNPLKDPYRPRFKTLVHDDLIEQIVQE
jgi:hypothetical protein